MSIFSMKPARAKAEARQEDEEMLCDLDIITNRDVTFYFQGKRHVILPITSEVFFHYWEEIERFKKEKQTTAKENDEAFLRAIRIVCDTITLKEVEVMTVLQKANLLKHITNKVTGTLTPNVSEKKNTLIPTPSESA